jgi:membrane peptidoglycan carboxypeptidase
VEAGEDGHLLIQEVRDRHGNVLYRATPKVVEAFSPREGALVEDMLANVVAHGTARRMARSLEDLWVGGKTGTTNGYRNAAFLGFVEGSKRYHLGVYVGYDDNRKMVRGNTRLAGSSGALPAWGSTILGLVELGVLSPRERQELVPLVALPVNVYSGLPMAEGAATVRIHAPTGKASRRFAPFEGEEAAPVQAPAAGLLAGSIWDEIAPVEQ